MESDKDSEDKSDDGNYPQIDPQIEDVRQKNYESQTKIITTISWAGAAFIMALQRDVIAIMPFEQKLIAFVMFVSFTLCLVAEIFASNLYAKSCELIDESDSCYRIYYDIARMFLMLRNFLFFVSLTLLIVIVYFFIFTS